MSGESLVDQDLESLRAKHWNLGGDCAYCATAAGASHEWPCDTARLLDAFEVQAAQLARLREAQGKAMNLARYCVKALKLADLYLDGFVWFTEPEARELRRIRRASKKAQDQLAAIEEVLRAGEPNG